MSTERLKGTAWLVLGKGRYPADVTVRRVTQSRPALKAREVAFRINLDVPASLFEEPTVEVELTLPEHSAVLRPDVQLLDAEHDVSVEAEVLPSDWDHTHG